MCLLKIILFNYVILSNCLKVLAFSRYGFKSVNIYRIPHTNMVYQGELDTSSIIKNCEMIIAVPTNKISVQDLAELKKSLPSKVPTAILPSSKIIDSLDSTPFCLMLDHIKGTSHLFIFIDNNASEIYDAFLKWVRSVSDSSSNNTNQYTDSKTLGSKSSENTKTNCVIAKRGHVVSLDIFI